MFGLDFEKVQWSSSDGARLKGWWVPAPQFSDKTVICCHGWGTNSGDILEQTWYLAKEGFNLFYMDFRGCGDSERWGLCSLGFYETQDLQSAVRYLRQTRPGLCRLFGVYGLSMGGVVALNIASKPEGSLISAIAAEAPFGSFNSSIGRYVKFHYGLPAFVSRLFLLMLYARTGWADHEGVSPLRTAAHFGPPHLLLIYGDKDYLAHPSDGQAIHDTVRKNGRTKSDFWLCPQADHDECFDKDPKTYRQKLTTFFKQALI